MSMMNHLWNCTVNAAVAVADTVASGARSAHAWVRPWCWKCREHALRHEHCGLCGCVSEADVAEDLLCNLREHGEDVSRFADAGVVCHGCYEAHWVGKCVKTGRVFAMRENCAPEVRARLEGMLLPYRGWGESAGPLSPEGELLLEVEAAGVEENLGQWRGVARGAALPGAVVEREIQTVACREECEDVEELERRLTLYAAQVGGNGLTHFSFTRHVERWQEWEVIGSRGAEGRPVYGRRWEESVHFTGHGVAVATRRFDGRGSRQTQRPRGIQGAR